MSLKSTGRVLTVLLPSVVSQVILLGAQAPVRINSGGWGPGYVDASGAVWGGDVYGAGGVVSWAPNAALNPLYRSHRFGAGGLPIRYTVPVQNGNYAVTLKFAEPSKTAAGQRKILVKINNATVEAGLDVYALGGANPVDRNYLVSVSGGVMVLDFMPVVAEPMVSGIQILPVTTAPSSSGASTPSPTVGVNPGSANAGQNGTVQFAATVTNSANTAVVWSMFSGLGSVSATGLYTAPASIAAASVAVVKATHSSGASATANVMLSPPAAVTVSVNPGSASAGQNGTVQFNATVANSANTAVTWSVSAGPGAISTSGLYSAPSSIPAPTTATVKATHGSGVFGTATVNLASTAIQETGGLVTIEAEDGEITNRTQSWTKASSQGGYSGTGYLAGTPNSGVVYSSNYLGTAPFAKYLINFAQAGTYYIWVRGFAASVADDSLHIGLDGLASPSSETISEFTIGEWSWTNYRMDRAGVLTINVPSAGLHWIGAYMREDGFLLDKLILTRDSAYRPVGAGPAPSVSTPAPTGPQLSVSPTSLSFVGTAGQGGVAAKQVNIVNTGSGTLSWTVTGAPAWLQVSPSSGTGAATLQVTPTAVALSANTYSATLSVNAGSGGSSPVSVSFLVSNPGAPVVPTQSTAPVLLTSASFKPIRQFFVTTTGKASGDGSASNPWDIATAFNKSSVIRGGDVIWLRGGNYGYGGLTYFPINVAGNATNPVYIRAWPNERVTLNAWITLNSPYVWIWGVEVMNTQTNRTDSGVILDGIDLYNNAVGARVINSVIHDRCNGIGMWEGAADSEAYGNIIFNNGYAGPTRGHCHGIYTQNKTGKKIIHDNIVFNQFGLGMQIYGSPNAYVVGYDVQGNTSYNNGRLYSYASRVDNILVGGAQSHYKRDILIKDNYTYNDPTVDQGGDGYSRMGLDWDEPAFSENIVVKDNYFMGGEVAVGVKYWNTATFTGNTTYSDKKFALELRLGPGQSGKNYIWDNNKYFGTSPYPFFIGDANGGTQRNFADWKKYSFVDANSTFTPTRPTGIQTFVRPNRYEPGRANVTIYNWANQASVPVDLSGVLTVGAKYEIRDSQNFYGPALASGVYGGGSVSFPTTATTVQRAIGGIPAPASHTASEFQAYVVLTVP